MRKRLLGTFILSLCIMVVLPCLLFASGEAENAKGSEKITLKFFETMTSPSRTQYLQELIARYEAQNPNINIELISPPYEQSDNKLTMMLNSNQELDIVEVRDYHLKQFVNNGKLRDLTEYIDNWDQKDDLLDLTVAASKTVNNTPYLIPQFFYVKALLVRTDILEKYDIAIPSNLDEFYAACEELSKKAPGQYGYALRGKSNTFKISDVLIAGNVGNINPDFFYEDMNGNFWLDNENGRKALAEYVELYKKGSPSDSIGWGFNEQINGFVSGATPFLIQDPDVFMAFEGQLDPSQYTVVPIPTGTSGKRYLEYGFNGPAIPVTSKHPDEAWDFIKFMLSEEESAAFCKFYGPLPIQKSVFEDDPYFSSGKYEGWAEEMNSPNSIFAKYPMDDSRWPGWGQYQETTMQALLLGNATIDETIELWKEYWGF